jgi:hypothetical protein
LWNKWKKKLFGSDSKFPVPIPIVKIAKSIFCNCSDCEIQELGLFENLPLDNGHWTSCGVHKCKNCKRIGGFPQSNLELAITSGTQETKEALRRIGVPVDEYLTEFNKKNIKSNNQLNPSRRDEK